LTVDSRSLPISHRRNDMNNGPSGVWDGAQRCGVQCLVVKSKTLMQKSKIDEPGTVVANRGYQGFQYEVLKENEADIRLLAQTTESCSHPVNFCC
jgi:hypothetical protein